MLNTVIDEIVENLKEMFNDKIVDVRTITKNNGVEYTGVTIRTENESIAPLIYLEPLLEKYDVSEVVKEIACIYNNSCVDIDISSINSYESVKHLLRLKLVNSEKNKGVYKVFKEFLDLYAIPIIALDDIPGKIIVTPALIKSWGVTQDDVFRDAMCNLKSDEIIFTNINNILNVSFTDILFYILTNKSMAYGASVIMNNDVMGRIASDMNDDLIIIPSSIHEVLILPASIGVSDEINQMINEVNSSQLNEEEILSDHYYIYNKDYGWK